MNVIINAAFLHSRAIYLMLFFIFIAGYNAYQKIPKEAEPDIAIPIIYVSMTHDGISPEDAERLLVRPMEKELQSIEGVKEMTGTASEGHASVMLEFYAGFDNKRALADVCTQVDIARSELPSETDEPIVNEVNIALFPVLNIALTGAVTERMLVTLARDLQDRVESLQGVLEVDIGGDREPLLEVVVDPGIMETYGVQYAEFFNMVSSNNLLVAAGAMDTSAGRFVVKVPGIIEKVEDILNLPLKVDGNNVVTLGQVASIRKGYKDPQGFARVNGQPSVTLEVKKRLGANIIGTNAKIREIVEAARQYWPESIDVVYMQDKSENIRDMLSDLQNNIMSAIILVMIVIIIAMGIRSALLVGLAIPGSFLSGIMILEFLGYTMNLVVLFSLILVVGMLVDGAIVVSELADRYMNEGKPAAKAYADASKRMSWPIIVSTLTTLAVFMPLIFWPGIVGEFMKFLPITVIICLTASLAMTLIFIPIVGGSIGKRDSNSEIGSGKITKIYSKLLNRLLVWPWRTALVALTAIMAIYIAYGAFGKGVEFFPDIEPEMAMVQIRARGNLSVHEKDAIVRKVEARIVNMPELESVYARSFNQATGKNQSEDVIGVLQIQFIDWDQRRKAAVILGEMKQLTGNIPGVVLEFRKAQEGPSQGKPIKLKFTALNQELINTTVARVREEMDRIGGFRDIEDNRPLPGIEWRLMVNRGEAARYGANISLLGSSVQLVTNGIRVTNYRPNDENDKVDIRVRYPHEKRNLEQLNRLTVPTNVGMIPASNFVTLVPAQKTGTLSRSDARRAITLQADVEEGLLVNDKLIELRKALMNSNLDPAVQISLKGEDEDRREAMTFLINAFLTAVFLMFLILVILFNSIYQSVLVLSAIVFSISGMLLGLMVTGQPFGIVMVGIGVIALAGIVVNNNIILIDTYNRQRTVGKSAIEAAVYTGNRRFRPVFLTAFTTVLGLMPMVLSVNIDLFGRTISIGAPSTQWWTQLSSVIVGGLSFATLLALLLTPCLLVIGDNTISWIKDRRRQGVSVEQANSIILLPKAQL